MKSIWWLVPLLGALLLAGTWATPLAAQEGAAEEAASAAVARAHDDALYAEAYRRLDPTLLEAAWGGEALLDMQDDLERLRRAGQYLDLTLHDLEIRQVAPLGPSRVRVVARERWLVRVYRADGTYLGFQRQLVDNRYVVQSDGDTWRIVEVDQEVLGGDPALRPGEPEPFP